MTAIQKPAGLHRQGEVGAQGAERPGLVSAQEREALRAQAEQAYEAARDGKSMFDIPSPYEAWIEGWMTAAGTPKTDLALIYGYELGLAEREPVAVPDGDAIERAARVLRGAHFIPWGVDELNIPIGSHVQLEDAEAEFLVRQLHAANLLASPVRETDLVKRAIRTLLPGLRAANYVERWSPQSPAVEAVGILCEFVGEPVEQPGDLLDPHVPTAHKTRPEGQAPVREPESGTLRIENGWLLREFDYCTCNPHYGAHERHCGLVPELDLSTLPGWRSEAEIKAEALREFADARYRAYLDDPDIPWVDQPSNLAKQYTRSLQEMYLRADTLLADQVTGTTDSRVTGTGAGEGAPGQDTGSAWVTPSTDCPEAPAQARHAGTTNTEGSNR